MDTWKKNIDQIEVWTNNQRSFVVFKHWIGPRALLVVILIVVIIIPSSSKSWLVLWQNSHSHSALLQLGYSSIQHTQNEHWHFLMGHAWPFEQPRRWFEKAAVSWLKGIHLRNWLDVGPLLCRVPSLFPQESHHVPGLVKKTWFRVETDQALIYTGYTAIPI